MPPSKHVLSSNTATVDRSRNASPSSNTLAHQGKAIPTGKATQPERAIDPKASATWSAEPRADEPLRHSTNDSGVVFAEEVTPPSGNGPHPGLEPAPKLVKDPSLINDQPAFESVFSESSSPPPPSEPESEPTAVTATSDVESTKKPKKSGRFGVFGRIAHGSDTPTPAPAKDNGSFARRIMKGIIPGRATMIKTDELSEDDAIVAIMGPTGAGKSTFVQIATGVEGIGHSLESYTTEIRVIRMQHPDNTDASVVFVDTPGFDDTNKSDVEILNMVADWLKHTYQKHIKLAGILYFHRITDNRMAGTILKNLKMFERLCGEQAQKNIILTTTMWNLLPDDSDTGAQRETELKEQYWKPMIDHGSRTARFMGTYESAWKIVEPILLSAELRQVTLLQQELVDQRMQVRETTAGKQLFSNLETLVNRQRELLERLREESKEESDEDALAMLKTEYETVRKELERTMNEMQGMKIPLGRRLTRLFSRRLAFFKKLGA